MARRIEPMRPARLQREIGLEPRTTAVRSPQSNGIAESFVKTMKRDYIEMMPKPDSRTAVGNLAIAFEHYNEHHPHSASGMARSPRGIFCVRRSSNPKRETSVRILWGQIHSAKVYCNTLPLEMVFGRSKLFIDCLQGSQMIEPQLYGIKR